jgi:hypothetical protein
MLTNIPVILKSKEARISFFYLTVTKIIFCFNCCRVKPRTMTLVLATSLLSTQHKGEMTKTGWLGIRIMCPSELTCLSTDCEPAL